MTLFFSPDEVSNWQAACKSGKVWLRLLKKVAVTKLAGVSYAVCPSREANEGSGGGTDVEV